MTIRGADRRDVLIEAAATARDDPPSAADQAASGLRRLTQRGGFTVDEQANTMRLTTERQGRDNSPSRCRAARTSS